MMPHMDALAVGHVILGFALGVLSVILISILAMGDREDR